MSEIWETLIVAKDRMIELLDQNAVEVNEQGLDQFNQPENGWVNRVWANESIRRAHIDIVDVRQTRKLWMMHVCVFPQLHNDGPIFGFDVIAGERKMTGAFHDFSASSSGEGHPLIEWYKHEVSEFVPTKARKLPEWATNIFTDSMIAASNVKTVEETTEICNMAVNNLDVYLQTISDSNNTGNRAATLVSQNYYCDNQRQNPHTPKVMKNLGLDEADVDYFCNELLFPKTN